MTAKDITHINFFDNNCIEIWTSVPHYGNADECAGWGIRAFYQWMSENSITGTVIQQVYNGSYKWNQIIVDDDEKYTWMKLHLQENRAERMSGDTNLKQILNQYEGKVHDISTNGC